MRHIRLVLIVFAATFTMSCAHFARPVSGPVKSEAAVIYGRFELGQDLSYENQLALQVENTATQKKLLLRFRQSSPVYGVATEPGQYAITGFVATDRMHRIWGRRVFSAPILFQAPAGKGVYIGDFKGTATWDGGLAQWGIRNVTNNFAGTSPEFQKANPTLRLQMCIPARPLPAAN